MAVMAIRSVSHANNIVMKALLIGFLLCSSLTLPAQTILPIQHGVRSSPVVDGRLKIRLAAGISRAHHEDIITSLGLATLYPVLPFSNSLSAQRTSYSVQDINKALQAEEVLLRTYVVSYNTGEPPEFRIQQLHTLCSSVIECCSPVYAAELAGIPNDPKVSEQTMLATIHAFEAWDVEGGSDTLLIGISDSGVLPTHEDLQAAIALNTAEIPDNAIDDDGNGYVDDYRGYNFCSADDKSLPGDTYNPVEGHGTGVAGICGAVSNNNLGISGVAGKCKLWPLKTMPNNSRGIIYGYESLMYCAVNNIPVVNCSWGSTGRSCVDESIVAYVIARGTAIVAAAGNHRSATPFYPGSYAGVLNVGVTNPNDDVIGMSGHGPTVDIMAPGQETVTTSNNGGYGTFCCTSGSSPIAAAVVALVRSHYPVLSPIQACALVRESADPSPWKSVQSPVNPELLPYGRLNAYRAVTMKPDSLPSVEWDSVDVRPSSGSSRWGVGDTLLVTLYGTNVLADWTMEGVGNFHFTPAASQSCLIVNADTLRYNNHLVSNQQVVVKGIRCLVMRATDSTVYVNANLYGRTKANEPHARPISIAITPSPAFRTLTNDVLTFSVGDRGRFGNTDLDAGQGAGLVYRTLCGQLYEGGLMISANNRVVDVVRGVRGVDAHLTPEKKFVAPDSLSAIFTDDDAPDSLRLGVRVECTVAVGSADTASIVFDVTVENTSDSVLVDPAIAWFCDWDLGRNAGHNNGYVYTDLAPDGLLLQAAGGTSPMVWCSTSSRNTDAMPIYELLDNAATYPVFSLEDKLDLLHRTSSAQILTDLDLASITGVRFTLPIPPRQRRSFRQVFVIDTAIENLRAISDYLMGQPHPSDTLITSAMSIGKPFPNPASTILSVPIRYEQRGSGTVTLFDLQGRIVYEESFPDLQTTRLVTLDVTSLPVGIYQMRWEQNAPLNYLPTIVRTQIVILR